MKSAHLRALLAVLALLAAFAVAACGETKDENAASDGNSSSSATSR